MRPLFANIDLNYKIRLNHEVVIKEKVANAKRISSVPLQSLVSELNLKDFYAAVKCLWLKNK